MYKVYIYRDDYEILPIIGNTKEYKVEIKERIKMLLDFIKK